MKIIVGCERFGVVREAFRRRGHDAWSCDVVPAEDGSRYHYQCDVLEVLGMGWDMGIFHPDCTYLTSSAEWAYGDGPYHQKIKPQTLVGASRRQARLESVKFVEAIRNAGIFRIAIENPVGILSTQSILRKPSQIIQPWQFGDDASKKTCLWLKNLPILVPTNPIPPRMVDGRPRWANQTDSGQNRMSPSADRAMLRAATYPGIAEAMATQWSF